MSAFSPRQMFLLDLACKPISEAFGGFALYLVGTSTQREDEYRDVDLRLILKDKKYDRMAKALGRQAMAFLGISIGQYLHSLTGLPIDFQIQRMTEANERHEGMRVPMGCRSLVRFDGDAVPEYRP